MSTQQALLGGRKAQDPKTLPIYALWGAEAEAPKKGDLQRVVSAVRLMVDGCDHLESNTMTIGDVAKLTAPEARTHITPKRLFDFVNRRLAALKLGWRVEEKWPGRRVVTDLWRDVWLDVVGTNYPWDLHLCSKGPFESKDHQGALTVRDGIGPMVLAQGEVWEEGEEIPAELQRWYASAAEPLSITHEEAQGVLQEGQLVLLDGERWRPADLSQGERPQASVVVATVDGYELDRSTRAIVEPFLASTMRSYILEMRSLREQPSLQGFSRRLQAYVGLVAGVQHEDVQRQVVALPFRSRGGTVPPTEREQAEFEAQTVAMVEAFQRNCGHMTARGR